jgi:hypothetical protein
MRSLAGFAVACWLGVMGCFAFIAAPTAFATLERDAAARFVAGVFPRYYLVGVNLGLLALAGLAGQRWLAGPRTWDWMGVVLVVAMVGLTLYAWLAVLPAAHVAREGIRREPAQAQRFARLHRLSTALNGAVMLAGLVFLVVQAGRRP